MYIDRIGDELLENYLQSFGAIVVEGPKWCGKTTSAARLAASELRIADPANGYLNRRLVELDVSRALEGERPRLIDEWQEVPATWDAVRYACDEAGVPGQFLLTGSSTPRKQHRPIHSGAGRIGHFRMDTLTLYELGVSSGSSSLRGLFEGGCPSGVSNLGLDDVAELACRGGWPAVTRLTTGQAMRVASGYIDAVVQEDLEAMDGVVRDPAKVRRLITSLARNESTLASKRALALDTAGPVARELAESTVNNYLTALSKVFFTNDIPAWNPAIRSPVRIRATHKRHLADSSLAVAALGLTPKKLASDLKTLGFLFESMVAHDLIAYARTMEARVFHYRDDSNLEVDLIVERDDGSWGGFEVKLGTSQEDDGAANVLALERKMTERGERPASIKAVIVGIGAVAHVRSDGVAIIPFDSLGV